MPDEITITVKDRIHTIRDQQVMLDSDLAILYEVETKQINRAVKRNIERFPKNFMFQLTEEEYGSLRSQIVTLENEENLRFQNGTSSLKKVSQNAIPNQDHGGRRYLPYAFTEQGVAMLSGVLKSNVAIKVSIQIMEAFVAMRKFIQSNAQVFQRFDNVERKLLEHDRKFEEVFKAIEEKDIKPDKGIFFDGQVFDAHKFVSDLIRSAKEEIILIDNYVDDKTLTLFLKRKDDVLVKIYTKNITKALKLDLEKE